MTLGIPKTAPSTDRCISNGSEVDVPTFREVVVTSSKVELTNIQEGKVVRSLLSSQRSALGRTEFAFCLVGDQKFLITVRHPTPLFSVLVRVRKCNVILPFLKLCCRRFPSCK